MVERPVKRQQPESNSKSIPDDEKENKNVEKSTGGRDPWIYLGSLKNTILRKRLLGVSPETHTLMPLTVVKRTQANRGGGHKDTKEH